MNGPTMTIRGRHAPGTSAVQLPTERRILSQEECEAIWARVRGFARGGGETSLWIGGQWTGELRWARNRVSLASDRRELQVAVWRVINGSRGEAYLNQLDDASLQAAVGYAERMATLVGQTARWDFLNAPPTFVYSEPAIWSDATLNLATEARAQVAQATTDPAEAEALATAGYLEVKAVASAFFADDGGAHGSSYLRDGYSQHTAAQCSTTVRDQRGTASGWAGLTSYDWGAIDYGALAARALEKARASRNPVAIEPGRYTVILEPQAVHDLVTFVIDNLDRRNPELFLGSGPFRLGPDRALELGRSKLGLQVVDERITIDHDPMDPRLGVSPWDRTPHRSPHRPVTWIENGKLMALDDEHRDYALATRNAHVPVTNSGAFRMSGGDTSIDEMIRTTKRGLLVTRFSNARLLDGNSLLATGVTRDGLWLIENGQISKAVKNLRFTESPLFVLNALEQLGVPVPVFRLGEGGLTPAIVPPLKARDFSFTSTIDAI